MVDTTVVYQPCSKVTYISVCVCVCVCVCESVSTSAPCTYTLALPVCAFRSSISTFHCILSLVVWLQYILHRSFRTTLSQCAMHYHGHDYRGLYGLRFVSTYQTRMLLYVMTSLVTCVPWNTPKIFLTIGTRSVLLVGSSMESNPYIQ